MPVTLLNKITQEKWLCDDFEFVRLIDCQKFVLVYKENRPTKLLMNKDCLVELKDNLFL